MPVKGEARSRTSGRLLEILRKYSLSNRGQSAIASRWRVHYTMHPRYPADIRVHPHTSPLFASLVVALHGRNDRGESLESLVELIVALLARRWRAASQIRGHLGVAIGAVRASLFCDLKVLVLSNIKGVIYFEDSSLSRVYPLRQSCGAAGTFPRRIL